MRVILRRIQIEWWKHLKMNDFKLSFEMFFQRIVSGKIKCFIEQMKNRIKKLEKMSKTTVWKRREWNNRAYTEQKFVLFILIYKCLLLLDSK